MTAPSPRPKARPRIAAEPPAAGVDRPDFRRHRSLIAFGGDEVRDLALIIISQSHAPATLAWR
jgi:hypothetical protein